MDADAWNDTYAEAPLEWGVDPNRWVVQELASLMPGTALDLAAGEGRNAIWLATEGWKVTAVDFSDVAVDRARDLARTAVERLGRPLDVEWRVEDATKADLPRNAFDVVLLCYLQLPAYERREVLRLGARALAPGGVLLVVGHDPTNIDEGVGGPQDPSVLYSAADIETDLQDYLGSGTLVVERSGRVAREIPTEEGPRNAWDVLVRMKARDPRKTEVTFG